MGTQLLAVVAGLLLGADNGKDEARTDKDKLQGTWRVVKFELRGESKDDVENTRWIVSGDGYTVTRGGKAVVKGKYKLDPEKTPKEIDLEVIEDREDEKNNGTILLAIYAMEGDTLKYCVHERGKKVRPKAFDAKADEPWMVVTFKKEKQ